MLGKFLKLIGLDKPFDESRRAAITTVGKAALYPVLNSVVPEVLSEPKYSDEELAIAEKLYALGSEIRGLKRKEDLLSCWELQKKACHGGAISDTLASINANRDAINNLCDEFEKTSQLAISKPKLIGWSKKFLENSHEKISITTHGTFITSTPLNDVIDYKKSGSAFTPYIQPEISIRRLVKSRAELDVAIEQTLNLGNLFKSEMDRIKNITPIPPSRYSLCHTGKREQFSFEQDSKSWRDKLKQDHDECIGRY